MGAKDRIPRGTMRALCAAYVEQNPEKIAAALDRAVGGRFPDKGLALLLKAEGDTINVPQLDNLADALKKKIVHNVSPGPSKAA